MMETTDPFLYLTDPAKVRTSVVDKYEGFLFDMDGVLWEGERVIPGAAEAVDYLTSIGKQVFFVTNNSTSTRQQYVDKLSKIGIRSHVPERIFCASSAMADYLRTIQFKGKAYVIGGPGLINEIRGVEGVEVFDNTSHNVGIHPLEMAKIDTDPSIKLVVMGFDTHINYFKIAYAGSHLFANPSVPFLATNLDKHFPAGRGKMLPGNGAFVSALAVAAGRPPTVIGKPGPFIIEEVVRKFAIPKSKLAMIGDNLFTDIEFGSAYGIATVMVETGVGTRAEASRPEHIGIRVPDFVIPSVASLLPPSDVELEKRSATSLTARH